MLGCITAGRDPGSSSPKVGVRTPDGSASNHSLTSPFLASLLRTTGRRETQSQNNKVALEVERASGERKKKWLLRSWLWDLAAFNLELCHRVAWAFSPHLADLLRLKTGSEAFEWAHRTPACQRPAPFVMAFRISAEACIRKRQTCAGFLKNTPCLGA